MPARKVVSLTWSTLRNALGVRRHHARDANVTYLASIRLSRRLTSLSSHVGVQGILLGGLVVATFLATLFVLGHDMPSLLTGWWEKNRSGNPRPQPAPLPLAEDGIDFKTARFQVRNGVKDELGTVIDGDTLAVGSRRIRLHGIDAPEKGQTCLYRAVPFNCGIHAAKVLAKLVAGHGLTCDAASTDQYGRQLAICIRSDGLNVNRAMVASGWALAYRRYDHVYGHVEDLARLRGYGLWAVSFTAPEAWRRGAP